MDLLTFDKMCELTKEFYRSFDIEIKDIKLAVASLTMGEYKVKYNQMNKDKIDDQNALATVGDSICCAYLMMKEYKPFTTKKILTDLKDKVTNVNLNPIGKRFLNGHLFFYNNDLTYNSNGKRLDNKKSYATAFEAFIGFIALNNKDDLHKIADIL